MGCRTFQMQMRLFSYIVARDYGFAPNPFHGYCTLATCKPKIRAAAAVGDWVVGTGAKTKYGFSGRLIYAMQVGEVLDFDSYWNDPRFACKRPVSNGSLKQLYGDNIYHRRNGYWIQADSHHSLEGGAANPENVSWDTSANRVLISTRYVYFGSDAPVIPRQFRPYQTTENDFCCSARGHRNHSAELASAFEEWLGERGEWGLRGLPLEFPRHKRAPKRSGRRP